MLVMPEYSENKEKAVVLYFSTDGADEAALRKQIESAYVCCSRMGDVTRNGKRYIAVEIEDE